MLSYIVRVKNNKNLECITKFCISFTEMLETVKVFSARLEMGEFLEIETVA